MVKKESAGDMKHAEAVYVPDNSIKNGYVSLMRDIVFDLAGNRWLTWQLFKRDFVAMYKQSLVGFFWAAIVPVVSLLTFMLLNHSGVLSCGNVDAPYPIFALTGLAFWQLFSVGLITSSGSLVKAGDMIVKINFSKKSLVIAAFGQCLCSFLIQLLLVTALFFWYRRIPHPTILLIPVLAAPIILLTLGLGFIIALLNGILRDVGNLISVLLTFLMFLTPVLYAKPVSGIMAAVSLCNPLYYLICGARDFVLFGTFSDVKGYAISCCIAVMVFIVSTVLFHLTETRISERI